MGTAPPNEPEWMSVSGPNRSIWASARPRMPVQTVGVSSAHIPVSEMITTSAASRAASRRTSPAKFGEPDSSSPSTSSLRFTAGAVRPVAARWARTPRVWKNTWPLSSAAPRAKSRRPTTVGVNGSVAQPSAFSAGWTSWWPYTSTVGADESPDGHSANTAGRPSVSQTSATGKPVSPSFAASHSAERRTSPARPGSAETDGMASQSQRSARKALSCRSMKVRTTLSGVLVIRTTLVRPCGCSPRPSGHWAPGGV